MGETTPAKKSLNLRIEAELKSAIDEAAETRGITRTSLVEDAVRHYLELQPARTPGALLREMVEAQFLGKGKEFWSRIQSVLPMSRKEFVEEYEELEAQTSRRVTRWIDGLSEKLPFIPKEASS